MSVSRQVRSRMQNTTQQNGSKQRKTIGWIGFSSCNLVHVLVLCVAVRKQKCRHYPHPTLHFYDCYRVIEPFPAFTLILHLHLLSIFTLSLYLSARLPCSISIYAYCFPTPPLPPIHFHLLLFSLLSFLPLLHSMILTSQCIFCSCISYNTDPSSSPPPCPALPCLLLLLTGITFHCITRTP